MSDQGHDVRLVDEWTEKSNGSYYRAVYEVDHKAVEVLWIPEERLLKLLLPDT